MRLAFLSLLFACTASREEENKAQDMGLSAPVEIQKAWRAAIGDGVRATATLQAKRRLEIRARAAGVLRSLALEEGDAIQEGQLLIRLEQEGLTERIRGLQSSLRRAQRDRDELHRLSKRGLLPRHQLSEAEHAVEQARLSLKRQKQEARQLEIYAPFQGILTARHVEEGEAISPGTLLFGLADPSTLELELRVAERHLPRLKPGLKVELRAEGGVNAEGQLERIAPTVDPLSGTIKLKVSLKTQPGLKPGMFIRARIILDIHEQAILLPRRAVFFEEEQPFAFRVHEGRAEKLALRLGYGDGERLEVLSPIKEGDALVIFGQRGLKEGAQVEVVKEL